MVILWRGRTGGRAEGRTVTWLSISYPWCSASRARASSAIACERRDVSSSRNVPQRRRARRNVCRSQASSAITPSSKKAVAAAYERFEYDVLDVGGLKEVVTLTRGGLRDTLRWRLHFDTKRFSARKKMQLAKPFESKNNRILFIKRVGERFQSCLKTQTLLDLKKCFVT